MISEDQFTDDGNYVGRVEGNCAEGEDCVDRYDRGEGEQTEKSCFRASSVFFFFDERKDEPEMRQTSQTA